MFHITIAVTRTFPCSQQDKFIIDDTLTKTFLPQRCPLAGMACYRNSLLAGNNHKDP